jgi:hypothetical protein
MRSIVLLLLAATPLTQAAELPSPADLDAVGMDVATLAEHADRLDAACTAARDAATCYTRAWAAYRIAAAAFASGKQDDAGPALVACATTLAGVTGDATWGAEAKALLAGCYGMSIGMNPMKGMSLGPQTAQLTAEALAAAPDSPRVHLFAAQRLKNTPTAWGGDPDKAREHAARGLELATKAAPADAWGLRDLEWIHGELATAADD